MTLGVAFFAPMATVAAAFLAAGVGLYWNFRSAKAARKQPFLLKQLDLCLEVAALAGRLASTSEEDDWRIAREKFWEIYWGQMSIVENQEVKDRMVDFGIELRKIKTDPKLPASELEDCAYLLARALRVLILKSWDIVSLDHVLEDREKINLDRNKLVTMLVSKGARNEILSDFLEDQEPKT